MAEDKSTAVGSPSTHAQNDSAEDVFRAAISISWLLIFGAVALLGGIDFGQSI
jgi:hypothetical protein